MIEIKQIKPTIKLPGESSLLVKFNYDKNIVEAIKNVPSAIYHKKNQTWEIPVTSLARCIDTLSNYSEIDLNLIEAEPDVVDNTPIELSGFKTTPYAYQKDGIEYGLKHDKWLLLDAPGLGKTLQMIYLAQELKKRDDIEHCLIVCGINTLKHNWKKEIKTHSDLSCRILGEKTLKNGKTKIGSIKDRINDLQNPIDEFFVITNIETLRDDGIMKELTSGKANKFDMIVVDELHTCRTPTSTQGKHLLKLKAKYKVGLTGTLLVSNPLNAYVPLKFIEKDNSTFTNFKFYYCTFTGPFNNILLGYKNIEVLKDQIEKCSLRRTKDLLDLPEKNIIHEYVTMEPDQERFYKNIVDGVVDECDKVEISTASLLSMITRLRQATACPSILTTENISSAKLNRAIDLARQIVDGGDKVVIYSAFKETLNKVVDELQEYHPMLCTGDVKDDIISSNIDRFQSNDDDKIICATVQKMGVGITLTRASYAIFIDTPYTYAECAQAEDRIHRIGSKKPVFIYYLHSEGTVDERVKEIVSDKEAIADWVIDNKLSRKSLDSLRKYIIDLKN